MMNRIKEKYSCCVLIRFWQMYTELLTKYWIHKNDIQNVQIFKDYEIMRDLSLVL